MEEMVPELEDLEDKGYFSKAEIRDIVRKREKFEYALKRRTPTKADYLRYNWQLKEHALYVSLSVLFKQRMHL